MTEEETEKGACITVKSSSHVAFSDHMLDNYFCKTDSSLQRSMPPIIPQCINSIHQSYLFLRTYYSAGLLDKVKSWVTTMHFACLFATPVIFYMDSEWGRKFTNIDVVTFFLALLLPPFGFVKPEEYFSQQNCPPLPKRSDAATASEPKQEVTPEKKNE